MIFKIKKGKHTSWPRFPIPIFRNELRFDLTFDESAVYPAIIIDYDHSKDINKAFGFLEGFNEDNSARVGWVYTDGKLLLYPYVHVNGEIWNKVEPRFIYEAKIGETVPCLIEALGERYLFTVGDGVITTPRGNGSWIKFLQFPYFGGSLTAPHDIKIKVTK